MQFAEKFDLVTSRQIPLHQLRQDVRRWLEEACVTQMPQLNDKERNKLVEELMQESPVTGPLEELLRDPEVAEIVVGQGGQALVRKGSRWQPTKYGYSTNLVARAGLLGYARIGANSGLAGSAGVDVRMSNGFRLIAVIPPEQVGIWPSGLFVRMPEDSSINISPAAVTPSSGPESSVVVPGLTAPRKSGSISNPPREVPTTNSSIIHRPAPPASSKIVRMTPPASGVNLDLLTRLHGKVAEQLIHQLANKGIYDFNQVSEENLRKIAAALIAEVCRNEKISLDTVAADMLLHDLLSKITARPS